MTFLNHHKQPIVISSHCVGLCDTAVQTQQTLTPQIHLPSSDCTQTYGQPNITITAVSLYRS